MTLDLLLPLAKRMENDLRKAIWERRFGKGDLGKAMWKSRDRADIFAKENRDEIILFNADQSSRLNNRFKIQSTPI